MYILKHVLNFFNCQSLHQKNSIKPETMLTIVIEVDRSFPSSKAEQLCNAFVFGAQNREWE